MTEPRRPTGHLLGGLTTIHSEGVNADPVFDGH